eukprot:COSAG02_NODE_2341_length_9104_cov_2.666185_6_plen_93_part_00
MHSVGTVPAHQLPEAAVEPRMMKARSIENAGAAANLSSASTHRHTMANGKACLLRAGRILASPGESHHPVLTAPSQAVDDSAAHTCANSCNH